jgi:hypothetical protein
MLEMVVVGIKKQSEYEKRREKFCVFEELKFVSAINCFLCLTGLHACELSSDESVRRRGKKTLQRR